MVSVEKRKAIQKAITLTQQGRYDKAIAEYEAILSADPSDTSLYNTLGDLYAHIGSTSEAIACYQKLVNLLRAEGRGLRAIAVYKKIIKLEPDNLSACLACADLYAQEGFRAEAKHQYLSAAERSLKMGLDKQALDAYERVIRLEPGDTGGAAKLASLLVREGRGFKSADLLGRLAQEARTQGRPDDARLLYAQMVEVAPQMFTGWYCLGRIEFEAGRFQEAEKALWQAAQLDAGSPLPHLLLAQLYEQQRRLDRAKAAWRDLLRCDPKHLEAHHRLGLLYLQEGDAEAGVKEFDASARNLGESGELERAIALLGELGPAADHPLIQERLGELLERSGQPTEAEAAFRRAAELHLAAGRGKERERLLSRLLAPDPGDPEAAGRPALRATPGNGSATVELTTDRPSAQSIVEDGSRPSGPPLAPQHAGNAPEEMFQILAADEPTDLTVSTTEDESAGETRAPLAIIDFYLKQGMEAEARALLRRLVGSEPGNIEAAQRLAALESEALTQEPAPAPEIAVVQPDHAERPEGSASFQALLAELEPSEECEKGETAIAQDLRGAEKGLINLMAELEAGLLSKESAPGSGGLPGDLIQADSDSFMPTARARENFEAHYQLGSAYREMGLLDDAVAEFRRSAADERLTLQACHMVGLCLLERGDAEAAIHELGRGLSILGRPAEEYRAVKYDLATAYEAVGNVGAAVAMLHDLHAECPSFRDTESRLPELERQLARGAGRSGADRENVNAARQPPSG